MNDHLRHVRVTALVACRNEEKYIAGCLDSILTQAHDFEPGNIDIVVADGMSTDASPAILEKYARTHKSVRVFQNPNKTAPYAWNIGIKNATGDFLVILGAHAEYPTHYIRDCIQGLHECNADVAGGVVRAKPSAKTLIARTIAYVLNSPLGSGFSFRTLTGEPREVDTVFGACYTKKILHKSGNFDERLTHSQDMDLSMRIKKVGGKIFLLPQLVIDYYPKSTLWTFIKHNYRDGVWAVYPRKIIPGWMLKWRHNLPGIFVGGTFLLALLGFVIPKAWALMLLGISCYLFANLLGSLHLAWSHKKPTLLLSAPIVFAVRHLVYGYGTVIGFIKTLW